MNAEAIGTSPLTGDQSRPQVTVVCITYNHENYIRQALDSFLAQKTNFAYQIFVGEDHGPDHTADIIREYAQKYPDKIIPFLRETNMGAQRNLIDMCRQAQTPYIAFCEGDDYWIDDYKLQKQYDLMQSHPEYRACFHATEILADENWYLRDDYIPLENGKIILPFSKPGFPKNQVVFTMQEYIRTTPAHTSSYFFRWNYELEIPEWYYQHFAGDHSMMMLQVGKGLAGFIPDVMSVYRRSEVGVYFYQDRIQHYYNVGFPWVKLLIDLRDYFQDYYNGYCVPEINRRITNGALTYFRMMESLGEYDGLVQAVKDPKEVVPAVEMLRSLVGELEKFRRDPEIKAIISKRARLNRVKRQHLMNNRLKNYLSYASSKKDINIWLFFGGNPNQFSGNARHLFEYIIAFHPEIKAVWLTKNKGILKLFEAENLPGCKLATKYSRKLLKHAAVLITDSFRSDIFKMRGFNAGTKVIRLLDDDCWEELQNPQPFPVEPVKEDNSTEAYHDAFMAVVPSQKLAEQYSARYQLPIERFLIAGQPRMFAVPDRLGADEGKKVLIYFKSATKYRSFQRQEAFMLQIDELAALAREQDVVIDVYCCGKNDDIFMKRLSTYQNNGGMIRVLKVDDIYSQLPNYSAVISDKLGILYDFLVQDRPCIYFQHDEQEVLEKIPGIIVNNWDMCRAALSNQLKDSQADRQLRKKVREDIFGSTAVEEQASQKIVEEIQKRLQEEC